MNAQVPTTKTQRNHQHILDLIDATLDDYQTSLNNDKEPHCKPSKAT